MFGRNKIVIFSMYEKRRNESILNVSDGVQFFNIEIVLHIMGITLSLMVDLMRESAMPLKMASPPPCFSANSLESLSRFAKGESNTRHPIS
jgi:hypothetical protein